MTAESIITKVQFNLSNDQRIYDLLRNINKRKRAYMVKKMLNEYLRIQDVLATYNSSYNSLELERHIGNDCLVTEAGSPFAETIEYLLEDIHNND